MAHLAGDAEDDLLPLDEVFDRGAVAQVCVAHLHAVLDGRDVEPVSAELRDEAVDDGHLRAQLDEPDREVGADEAQSAGDEHLLAGIGRLAHSAPSGGRARSPWGADFGRRRPKARGGGRAASAPC